MIDAQGILAVLVGALLVGITGLKHRELRAPLIVGFATRVFALLYDVLQAPLPMGDDGVGWSAAAAAWSSDGLFGTLSYIGTGVQFYVWCMSVLYALCGVSTLMVQAVNVTLGTLVISGVFHIARALGAKSRMARGAAWGVALFPTAIAYSAVLLREAAATLALTTGVVYLARWHRAGSARNWALAVVCLIIATAVHSGAFALFVGGVAWLAVRRRWAVSKQGLRGRSVVMLLATAVVVVTIVATGFGLKKFSKFEVEGIDALRQQQQAGAEGRTQYLQDMPVESAWDALWQTPIRVVYFLFAPFPWMATKAVDGIAILDSVFYFLCMGALVRGRRIVWKNESALFVLAGLGAAVVVFAVGVTNAGTAMRHRAKLLPILVGVVAVVPQARATRVGARDEKLRSGAWERAVRDAPVPGCGRCKLLPDEREAVGWPRAPLSARSSVAWGGRSIDHAGVSKRQGRTWPHN